MACPVDGDDGHHVVRPTVDVAVRLGVDPREADRMVRGVVSLLHGTGSTVRVAVFVEGAQVDATGQNSRSASAASPVA